MTTAKVRVRGVFWRDSRKGTQTNAQTRARGDWYIRYTDQHGKLHKERVGPRTLAIELYRKRKTEVREGRFFPETAKKPVVLFDEIAEDFLTYSREHKKSAEHDEARMGRLKETFGGRAVGEISTQEVERLRADLGRKLSAASVNRHLALLEGHVQPSDEIRAAEGRAQSCPRSEAPEGEQRAGSCADGRGGGPTARRAARLPSSLRCRRPAHGDAEGRARPPRMASTWTSTPVRSW